MLNATPLKHTVRIMLGLFMLAGLSACPDNEMDDNDMNDNVMENRENGDRDDD